MAKLYGIKNYKTLNLSVHCETITIIKKFDTVGEGKYGVYSRRLYFKKKCLLNCFV